MDRKVLDMSVSECTTSRPNSGHRSRGNNSFNSRDSLRTNSLFTDGDLETARHTERQKQKHRETESSVNTAMNCSAQSLIRFFDIDRY